MRLLQGRLSLFFRETSIFQLKTEAFAWCSYFLEIILTFDLASLFLHISLHHRGHLIFELLLVFQLRGLCLESLFSSRIIPTSVLASLIHFRLFSNSTFGCMTCTFSPSLGSKIFRVIFFRGQLRWCNGWQARLANLYERVRVSLGAPFIQPCAKSEQNV